MLCGGINQEQPADKTVQGICEIIKNEAENQAGKKFDMFRAKRYRTQTVAGTNYFVKVHVGGEEYVHLEIYQQLECHGGEVKLTKIDLNKTCNEAI